MANTYFAFKQFTIHQEACAMKVTTDACLFGGWCARTISKMDAGSKRILDIGTGTGLLSLMIAQQTAGTIDAVEIDAAAATQAAQNTASSPFREQVTIVHADIAAFGSTGYDIIVSNPPFYEKGLHGPDAARNRAHHGTSLGWSQLFGLIQQKLKPGGSFFLLLPSRRRPELDVLLKERSLYAHDLLEVRQTPAHAPFRLLLKGGFEPQTAKQDEMCIRDNDNAYTPAFVDLLRHYYLHL